MEKASLEIQCVSFTFLQLPRNISCTALHLIFTLHFITMHSVKTQKERGSFYLGNWKETAMYTSLKPDSISHEETKK